MQPPEPIEVFRTIKVPLKFGGEVLDVEIPFTVELLERVEQALADGQGLAWLRTRRQEKGIRKVFEEFCKPYLPPTLDLRKVQPMFAALFFSHVRNELERSIRACMASMSGTAA